jgi:hypothetical protein
MNIKEVTLLRERDLLWCKAILNSGLDPRDMQKILVKFNRMRPDKKDDSFHRETRGDKPLP